MRMTENDYKDRIMSLLRQNPTKQYKEGEIRYEMTGCRYVVTPGRNTFAVNREYKDVTDALRDLVKNGAVHKEGDGFDKAMYHMR